MTPDLLTVRRSARLPAAKLAPVSTPKPVEVAPTPEPVTVARSPFERLASKNPAFDLLVKTLDLVEVWSTGGPELEPLPELEPVVVKGPVSPKLRQIAAQAFKPNSTYTEAEAIEILSSFTNVSTERARNGLAMMKEQNILDIQNGFDYYLAESTPF